MMTIIYQGKETETAASTLAEFISEQAIDRNHTIFEVNDEIIAPGGNLEKPLEDQMAINAFRIVAGG